MFHVLEVVGGLVGVIAIASVLLLGVVGPAWEGTRFDRSIFWVVFLPSLLFLLAAAFWLGKMFGGVR